MSINKLLLGLIVFTCHLALASATIGSTDFQPSNITSRFIYGRKLTLSQQLSLLMTVPTSSH